MTLKLLIKVSNLCTDLFVTFYLWDAVDGNLAQIVMYKVAVFLMIPIIMLIFMKMSKKPYRKWMMVSGQILSGCHIILLYVLGPSCIDFLIPLGIIEGISTGMFWTVYNQWDIEGVTKSVHGRSKYQGTYTAFSSMINISVPVIVGILMNKFGFLVIGLILVLLGVVISICADLYDDTVTKTFPSVSVKSFIQSLDQSGKEAMTAFGLCDLFRGMTHSFGSFDLFISIFLIGIFPNSKSFGAANSVIYVFAIGMGMVFSKIVKKYPHTPPKIQFFTWGLYAAASVALCMTKTEPALFLFILSYQAMKNIDSMNYGTATGIITNRYAKGYVVETYALMEWVLTIGRILGFGMLYFLYGQSVLYAFYVIAFLCNTISVSQAWHKMKP